MSKKIIFFILTCICIVAIFLFSKQVAVDSDAVSRGIAEKALVWLTDYENLSAYEQMVKLNAFDEGVRSLAHIGVFLVLGAFSFSFFSSIKIKRSAMAAAFLCAVYAVFDELHQEFFTDGRAFELVDLAKDWSGSTLGILLTLLLYRSFDKGQS